MGVQHIRAAYDATAGGPGLKAVLLALADRACDECGLAWPGIAYLSEHTEMGTTKVRQAIPALIAGGFLAVHAFPKGGRGLTTEYIVMPSFPKLSTAPCGKCREMQKRQHTGVGLKRQGGVKANASEPKSQHTGVDHPSEIHNPSGSAPPRNVETPALRAGARGAFGTSTQANIPEASQEVLRGLGILPPAAKDPTPPETA